MVEKPNIQKGQSKDPNKLTRLNRFWHQSLLWTGRLLMWLLAVVLLLVLVMAIPATRSLGLKLVLEQAHRFLPGELVVAKASWPQAGRLELSGIVWRVSAEDSLDGAVVGDTLAQVTDLIVDMDLMALRDKDLWLHEVFVVAGPVDVPNIIKLFPTSEATAAETDSIASAAFLRMGNLPPVPSLGLQQFQVRVRDIQINESLVLVQAGLQGHAELRADLAAAIKLVEGTAKVQLTKSEPMVFVADSLMLVLSANSNEKEFVLENFSVQVSEAGPETIQQSWRESETVSLHINGDGNWTESGMNVALSGVGVFPGPDHVRPLLPEEFPPVISGPLVGDFDLEISLDDFKEIDPEAQIRFDFSNTSWLEKLVLSAGLKQGRIQVDTLAVALLGVNLTASGWVDSTNVDLTLATSLSDPTLLRMFGGPSLASAEANLDLQARIMGPWPVPDLDFELLAGAKITELEVPSLQAIIRSRNRMVEANISLNQGLKSQSGDIDSLQFNWNGNLTQADSLSHQFDLGVWTPLGSLALGGNGTIDSVRVLRLDSLVVVGLDSTMRTNEVAIITQGPGPRDIKIENFLLEGGLGSVALGCELDSTGLQLDMAMDLLFREEFLTEAMPMNYWQQDGGSDVALKANVSLEGGDEGPIFSGKAEVKVVSHRDKPELGAALDFHLVRGDSSGLGADLLLFADDTSLITGRFRWPGQPDMDSGLWVPEPGRGLEISFPQQELDLALFNPALPAGIGLEGLLDFGAELIGDTSVSTEVPDEVGKGVFEGSLISGHVGFDNLSVEMPNRSRLALSMDADISGPVIDPEIKGTVTVKSGYLRIPEMPPVLLPVEGESLLWDAMARQAEVSGDTLFMADLLNPTDQGPTREVKGAAFVPNIDITLEIPGNVIVNGFGLNIELDGSIQATRQYDPDGVSVAVLKGRMGVLQGTLKFMNNIFNVSKADIHFNQSIPPNPHLDIKLEADVSGYLIYLEVTGFADDPEVELSSEPMMNKADVIAVLLFGQPANDLDNSQRGEASKENDPGAQLKDNLAALAVVFGGAGLQNKMSNSLGVDMVEMGSDSQGDNTIMVGKFITPKILLKHNQSLEKSGTYYMTLEYALSRYFKFISTYGQGEEASGLELKWSKRY